MTRKGLWKQLAAAAAALLAASTAVAQPLTAALSAEKSFYGPMEAIELRLTVRNESDADVAVLKWTLPFGGIKDDIFVVTRDGARVPYTGRLYKRPAPTAADWVRIPAGGELTGRFDLAGSYDLDAGGNCTVRFRLPLVQAFATGDAALAGTGSSEAVYIFLKPRPASKELEQEQVEPFEKTPIFRSCTATRRTLLSRAFASAQTYATRGHNYLVVYPRSTGRYQRWFGTFTTTRYNTVTRHFYRMKNAMATKQFTFDCSCRENSYSYVYPTRPYKIYLCRAFWPAPNTGEDSKAGTLVHETSHFDIIGNTEDYVYGSTWARWLARYYPKLAVYNADNHEYFVELK